MFSAVKLSRLAVEDEDGVSATYRKHRTSLLVHRNDFFRNIQQIYWQELEQVEGPGNTINLLVHSNVETKFN